MTITISTGAKIDSALNTAIASTIAAGREARLSFEAAPVIKPCLTIARSPEFRQLLQDLGAVALAVLWAVFALASVLAYAVQWAKANIAPTNNKQLPALVLRRSSLAPWIDSLQSYRTYWSVKLARLISDRKLDLLPIKTHLKSYLR